MSPPAPQSQHDFVQGLAVASQDVEEVAEAHQLVVALHGIPVVGEAVLVGIAVVLLDQDVDFDAPAVSGTQVAAFVEMGGAQRLGGCRA